MADLLTGEAIVTRPNAWWPWPSSWVPGPAPLYARSEKISNEWVICCWGISSLVLTINGVSCKNLSAHLSVLSVFLHLCIKDLSFLCVCHLLSMYSGICFTNLNDPVMLRKSCVCEGTRLWSCL